MADLKVLLVEDNLGDARLVQEMLADAGPNSFQVYAADCLVAALDAMAQRSFDVALVDLSLPDSQGLETLLTIQRHAPGLAIVALTGLASESVAMAAMERGVQDYLVKGTLTSDSLVRALRYAMVRCQNASPLPVEVEPAAVLGVMSAKGGVGTTTIACHYSVELQRQTKKKVLLVDLDQSAASASFLMKPQSEYTLSEASSNLHRLDASCWSNLVCSTEHDIDLLQSPGTAGFHDQLNGERVRHVLRFARTLYGYIVVDLGRLNNVSLNLIEEVGDLFLVTTPELPSLYEAGRVLKKLLELGMTRNRTHLLLNRSSRAIPCSGNDVEKALGYAVFATLGDYARELHEVYADGRFLDERQPLRKQAAQLVAKYLGVKEQTPPGRTRLGLFRFVRA